jgi:hypothetical protein
MNYTWRVATLGDVEGIVAIANEHFKSEIDTVFTPDPPAYARNLAYAVLNQSYYLGSELLSVALDTDNRIIAYNWAKANDRAWWSDDLMINVRMVHVIMDLPVRIRIQLVKDMMEQWEQLAIYSRNPVIHSSTMRHDQAGFLKLHHRAGYSVRGSSAYKRIDLTPK